MLTAGIGPLLELVDFGINAVERGEAVEVVIQDERLRQPRDGQRPLIAAGAELRVCVWVEAGNGQSCRLGGRLYPWVDHKRDREDADLVLCDADRARREKLRGQLPVRASRQFLKAVNFHDRRN